MSKRILFVGDGGDPGALTREAAGLFEVNACIRPLPFRIGGLRRHLGYLRLAWHALRQRGSVDAILIWQQFAALYFLFLNALIPGPKKPVLLYYVIYKPAANSFIDRLKFRAMRFMTNAPQLAAVYFMSKDDRLYAVTIHQRRRLLADHPFYSAHIEANLAQSAEPGFYFAGGASNRDYAVIRKLAELIPDAHFLIACTAKQAEAISPVKNLEIRTDVSPAGFDDLVVRSRAVILPLADPSVVSGQLVCLAAMQAGKPVFMTRNTFVGEWIDFAEAERFITFFDTADGLLSLLNSMTRETLAARGLAAREFYLSHHDPSAVYRIFAVDLRRILAQPPQ